MRDFLSTADKFTHSADDESVSIATDHPTPDFNTLYDAAIGKNVDRGQASLPLLRLEDRQGKGNTHSETIDVNGAKRTYSVHTPKDWDGKTPLKVMYFF